MFLISVAESKEEVIIILVRLGKSFNPAWSVFKGYHANSELIFEK